MRSTAVVAHRGSPDAALGIRENTLEAFLHALQLGADGVELDVRMTADGALAVHHDPVIDGCGVLCELTAGELPPHVPLLSAALDACAGLSVNIEIKNLPGEPGFDPEDQVVREVVAQVEESGWTAGVVVSSFWPQTLEAVRDAQPDLATGLLLASWFDPEASVDAALSRGCTALHPHVDLVSPQLVGRAHDAGLAVATWTVNGRSAVARVEAAGVDTLITDDVVLALSHAGPG